MRFRVIAGKHHDSEKSYKKGDVVHSVTDLAKTFTHKFEKLEDLPVPPAPSKHSQGKDSEKDADDEKKPADGDDKATLLAARGANVTEKFESAVKAKLSVFKREKRYHVYEPEELKPIKGGENLKQEEVTPAIDAFLES